MRLELTTVLCARVLWKKQLVTTLQTAHRCVRGSSEITRPLTASGWSMIKLPQANDAFCTTVPDVPLRCDEAPLHPPPWNRAQCGAWTPCGRGRLSALDLVGTEGCRKSSQQVLHDWARVQEAA